MGVVRSCGAGRHSVRVSAFAVPRQPLARWRRSSAVRCRAHMVAPVSGRSQFLGQRLSQGVPSRLALGRRGARSKSKLVVKSMFERFTEKAIKVVMLAQEEARRLGHNFVGTEQILLGLIGESTGIAAKVLKSMGVNLKDARVEVEKIIGRGSGFVAVEIPFTPRAKRVLELSLEEARQLGELLAKVRLYRVANIVKFWEKTCCQS